MLKTLGVWLTNPMLGLGLINFHLDFGNLRIV